MAYETYMIEMLDDISWQAIFSFNEDFNNFEEVVWANVKDFYDPWESPNKARQGEIINLINFISIVRRTDNLLEELFIKELTFESCKRR